MSTINPRLNVVLDPPIYKAVLRLAHKDGVSLSLKARDLIRLALEYCEDQYWVNTAINRDKGLSKKKLLSHKETWGRS